MFAQGSGLGLQGSGLSGYHNSTGMWAEERVEAAPGYGCSLLQGGSQHCALVQVHSVGAMLWSGGRAKEGRGLACAAPLLARAQSTALTCLAPAVLHGP